MGATDTSDGIDRVVLSVRLSDDTVTGADCYKLEALGISAKRVL